MIIEEKTISLNNQNSKEKSMRPDLAIKSKHRVKSIVSPRMTNRENKPLPFNLALEKCDKKTSSSSQAEYHRVSFLSIGNGNAINV